MNTKKVIILIVLIPSLLLFNAKTAKAAAPFRDLVAVSALLIEADSGEILFEYNKTERHPADALAKIMTLMLAAAACSDYYADPREPVVMTESAWFNINSNSATLGILPGEEMTLLDLMYCAFMGSNEACNLIAEHIAGSVDVFVENMNARAKALGCENTNFTNTHGQYNSNQYTTAMDQYIIFREALSNPLFVEISGVYRYSTESTNMSEPRSLVSTNSLLNTNGKYFYGPCTSGLASATFEGGYSCIAFAEADELSLISVVLGSDIIILEDESTQMRNLTESRRLFEWGFSAFGWRTILSSSELVAKAPVLNGAGADFVNLRPESSIELLLDKDVPLEQFKRTITIYSDEDGEPLTAPVAAGDILGEITLTRSGVLYGPIQLLANTNIELHRLVFIKMQITDVLSSSIARVIITALIVLIVIYIGLVVRYNLVRRKRLRRIKAAKKRLAEERRAGPRDPWT